MRSLEPEVTNAVWAAVKALIPPGRTTLPWAVTVPASPTVSVSGILIRLVTGCSWVKSEYHSPAGDHGDYQTHRLA